MDIEIFQTENFIVEAAGKPHIARTDGGHIRIQPKVKYTDRTQLSPQTAIELIRLTMVVGEAMSVALHRRGIDIGRLNYQDNGNWTVFATTWVVCVTPGTWVGATAATAATSATTNV